MILLLEDWNRYENAIIDDKTTNKSFLRLATVYRQMGIENNSFLLSLLNPELQGVDPFSKNLTIRQMAMIGIECKQNFWYFIREVCRVPAQAGNVVGSVDASRGNVAFWWSFFNHITFILTMPRQTGKSFALDALNVGLMNFTCNNTQINLMTKDDQRRAINIKALKDIYDELPTYLKFRTRDDTNNTESLTVKKLGNTFITHVPQPNPKRAYNMGRGLTTPIVGVDEAPFQVNIEIALGAMLPAMGAAVDRAKELNEPYGVLFTTTAGKKDEASGKYVYNYLNDSALWTELFLDAKTPDHLRELVTRNSRKKAFRIYGCFSHKQLGKTDEWLRLKLEVANQTPDEANRDYFNIWTSGSITSPLPTAVLDKMSASIQSEEFQQISSIGGYILRWFIPENQIVSVMNQRKMVIGIDTSDAGGGDDISFVMEDIQTGELVAIGTFNETNLIVFAQWLVFILETYVNTTMIIERRSSGVTIIDYLLLMLPQRGIDPFKRLFNWIVNDPMEHKQLYEEACLPLRRRSDDLYVRAKKYFGFATSGGGQTSRTELYSTTLQNAARRLADKIKDRSLTEQITGLVTRNGRVDHDIGGHDDLVIGWLLDNWFLTMATNLNFYDIDPKQVMIAIKVKVEVKPENAYFVQEQQQIREQMTQISEKLSFERDSFICDKLEKELRYLDTKLVLEEGEYCSIDAIIEEANNSRKAKSYTNNNYTGKSYYEKMGYSTTDGQVINSLSQNALAYSHRY
jgi:hypothetical protein